MNVNVNSNSNMPVFSRASRQISSDSISLDSSQALPPRVNPSAAESAFRGTLVSLTPNDSHAQGNGNGDVSNMSASVSSSLSPRSNDHRRRTFHRGSLSSVLDQDPSISEDEQEDDNDLYGMPDLDTTATLDTSSAPNTPPSSNTWNSATSAPHNATTNTTAANQPGRFTFEHECMGRNLGYLTSATAKAYRARLAQKTFVDGFTTTKASRDIHAVLIPEVDINIEKEVARMKKLMDEHGNLNVF